MENIKYATSGHSYLWSLRFNSINKKKFLQKIQKMPIFAVPIGQIGESKKFKLTIIFKNTYF